MKVKVLKKFRDKNTRIIHKTNEIIEVSEKRFNEISAAGPFIEKIEVVEETTDEKPEKAAKKK